MVVRRWILDWCVTSCPVWYCFPNHKRYCMHLFTRRLINEQCMILTSPLFTAFNRRTIILLKVCFLSHTLVVVKWHLATGVYAYGRGWASCFFFVWLGTMPNRKWWIYFLVMIWTYTGDCSSFSIKNFCNSFVLIVFSSTPYHHINALRILSCVYLPSVLQTM